MRNIRIAFVLSILSLAVWSAHSDDIAELRAGGQQSVDELAAQLAKAPAAQRADLETRLDRVCAQKDCASSRLFWYTDLGEAKAAAQRLHRPILALHLLGRLDEELSCANSRFFRTLLYPDDSISSILRGEYVLYWHSVRPVPHVTIEMGDGRVIHQTITGNSVHYLLDEDGNVLDALPGLYSPEAFRAQLQEWLALHRSLGGASAEARRTILRNHHTRLAAAVTVAEAPAPEPMPIAVDIDGSKLVVRKTSAAARVRKPTAIEASMKVMSKTSIEAPMLALFQKPTSVPIADLQPLAVWVALGEQHKDEVHFSPAAVELIRRKQFGSADVSEAAMNELLDTLRRNVAADTALNETTMRPRIHQWFANGEVRDLDSLNERIYRELFLTPNDDPWLGLKPPTVFTAIGSSS